MLFAVGTKVRFRHSGDRGIVTEILDRDMVAVLLDEDDHEIPAFVEDLIRAEDDADANPSVKAKIVPGKSNDRNAPPPRPDIETQYTILKSKGIQVAFAPIPDREASPEKFTVYLLNDTSFEFLYTFRFLFRNGSPGARNGKLPKFSFLEMGELLFDQLNDSPNIDLECWKITTEGTGPGLHRKLRIKPKQFFKRTTTAPLLNRKVHLFKVFDPAKFDSPAPEKKEDLRTYTKRNAKPLKKETPLMNRFTYDVQAFAEFIPELDLHIEKLRENHKKMSNAEILRLQLHHFERYLQQAIRVGVDRVFIIHGVGTGRLRDQIATRLLKMPEVKSFKNEFHPRYGWGATEVIFE